MRMNISRKSEMTYSQGMGRHCPCELVSLYTPLDFESSQTSGHNWSNALGTMRGLVCQCTGLSILVLVNGSCCMLLGTERTLAWLIWTSTNHCLIDLNIYKPLLDWFEHLQTFAWLVWTSTNICLIGLNIFKPYLDRSKHQQTFACLVWTSKNLCLMGLNIKKTFAWFV